MMGVWTPEQQVEHRRIWVEALRSGKYQQATGALRKGDAMCCLGVACDLSDLGVWKDDRAEPGQLAYLDYPKILPPQVKQWLGLCGSMGGFDMSASVAGLHYLADLNDGGKTFAEIADIIESEPPGLIATPEPAKPEGA